MNLLFEREIHASRPAKKKLRPGCRMLVPGNFPESAGKQLKANPKQVRLALTRKKYRKEKQFRRVFSGDQRGQKWGAFFEIRFLFADRAGWQGHCFSRSGERVTQAGWNKLGRWHRSFSPSH